MVKEKRFLCLGLIMRDILMSGLSDLPKDWEQTIRAQKVREDTGGGAANSARTLGRLGCQVTVAGIVGDDSAGKSILRSFVEDGVETEALFVTEKEATGTAVGLVRQSGERCFVTVQGCNKIWCRDHLPEMKGSYDFIHINGFFQFPAMEAALPALFREWKAAGSRISFDMASSDPSGRWFVAIQPFAGQIDYFFTNEYQLGRLTGSGSMEQSAAFLLTQGVMQVIVKRGKDGCMIFEQGKAPVSADGYFVEAMDTTGAGDSFDAAYLAGRAKGWDSLSCGRFANVVAGKNCTALGAVAGVPSYEAALETANLYYREKENSSDRSVQLLRRP